MGERRRTRPRGAATRPEKVVVAFSGYNPRGLVAFWRKLVALGVEFHIVAAGPDDFVFKTAYRDRVVSARRCVDLVWPDLVRVLDDARRASPQSDLVLCPSSEYLNQFALANRGRFLSRGVQIPLAPRKVYEMVSNKESFSALCESHHLQIPSRIERLDPGLVPFVAKPRRNIAGGRTLYPYLITTTQTYHEFVRRESMDDYYLEEFISQTGSYYLLYYLSGTGHAVSYSQRNLLQQGCGKSMLLCEPAQIHMEQLSSRIVRMLRDVGFFGLIMVEVRRKRGGYVVIEANPRLWGPFQLVVDNDIGIFDAFSAEHLGQPGPGLPRPSPARLVPYMWTGGLADARRRGYGVTWHLRKGPRRAFALARGLFRDIYLRRDTIRYYLEELTPAGH